MRMKEAFVLFFSLSLVVVFLYAIMAVYDFFHETPKQLKRIADKIDLRESNYGKGYDKGYADAMRAYGIAKDGDT